MVQQVREVEKSLRNKTENVNKRLRDGISNNRDQHVKGLEAFICVSC